MQGVFEIMQEIQNFCQVWSSIKTLQVSQIILPKMCFHVHIIYISALHNTFPTSCPAFETLWKNLNKNVYFFQTEMVNLIKIMIEKTL